MELPPARPGNGQTRTYRRAESIVFLKTNEPFGGLSNMAGGFPLCVNGIRILTSEALYQACRFPHLPEVQRLILEQASPMTAKMKSKPYRRESRPDWNQVRVKVMRWCLRVKLAQNWDAFSQLLLATGERPIVEQSRRDDFWGARPVDQQALVGMNVLGRLLMELREIAKAEGRKVVLQVEPADIPDFLLGGRSIETVTVPGHGVETSLRKLARYSTRSDALRSVATQALLFTLSSEVSEAPPHGYDPTAIDMDSYRVEQRAAMGIEIPDADAEIEPVPVAGGERKPGPELDRLSCILKSFNDQFGNIPWTDGDRVHRLLTEEIPRRVTADAAYQNAKQHSDRQNARIEHDKALERVITALLKDDTELFKQYMDNESFRQWLRDMVFGLTYEPSGEAA